MFEYCIEFYSEQIIKKMKREMDIHELRVGNWLFGNKPYKLDEEGFQRILVRSKAKLELGVTPIPITPEWLERFGVQFGWDQFDIEYLFEKYCLRLCYDTGMSALIAEIEYVHQLQNLYHALKPGEELTLKEDEPV